MTGDRIIVTICYLSPGRGFLTNTPDSPRSPPGTRVRLHPVTLPDSRAVRMSRLYPGAVHKTATRQVMLPVPTTKKIGGAPLRDVALLTWVTEAIRVLLLPYGNPSARQTGSPGVLR